MRDLYYEEIHAVSPSLDFFKHLFPILPLLSSALYHAQATNRSEACLHWPLSLLLLVTVCNVWSIRQSTSCILQKVWIGLCLRILVVLFLYLPLFFFSEFVRRRLTNLVILQFSVLSPRYAVSAQSILVFL